VRSGVQAIVWPNKKTKKRTEVQHQEIKFGTSEKWKEKDIILCNDSIDKRVLIISSNIQTLFITLIQLPKDIHFCALYIKKICQLRFDTEHLALETIFNSAKSLIH
jgi:hypothetical protein